MARAAVLGATGVTGRLVVGALLARGAAVVAAARDAARLAELRDGVGGERGTPLEIATVDPADGDALRSLAREVDVLVDAATPVRAPPGSVLDAAIAGRAGYVDLAPPARATAEALRRDAAAAGAGVSGMAGGALPTLVGDLLAAVAAEAVSAPRELHVTAYLGGARGPGRRGLSRGTRAALACQLHQPVPVVEGGVAAEAELAELRRLAWFPRPVGPHHAAVVPAGEALLVPRHLDGLQTVRGYLALSGGVAELLQAAGNVARREAGRRLVTRWVEGGPAGPSPAGRAAQRWAIVAEASGTEGAVARAWAYGHDSYGTAASGAAEVAARLGAGGGSPGVLAPAQLDAARTLLDALADASDLRWSLQRPHAATAAGPPATSPTRD